jgi:hypothetical protein
MTDKHCIDCKHFGTGGDCMRLAYTITEPVNGWTVTKGERRARDEREPIGFLWNLLALFGHYRCGPEGLFWEYDEEKRTGKLKKYNVEIDLTKES